MSWRRRAVGAGAAAVAGVALAAGATSAAANPRPAEYFSATTTASAVHVSFTQMPAASIITGALVDDAAGYAASGFTTGGSSEAQAAPFFPGNLVVQGPQLLCTDLFTCPTAPPAYPLLADASYPRQPSDAVTATAHPVGSGTALRITPSTAVATAVADANAAHTRTGEVRLLTNTPLSLVVGSSASATRVRTGPTGMQVRVSSAVSDVRIGSLLQIGAITTTDNVRLAAGRAPFDRPRVSVTDVTVAGHPASIDHRGLHVAGKNGPALARRVARSGFAVRSLGVTRSDHAHGAKSTAGGVELTLALPVRKAPYLPNPLASVPPFDQIPGVDLKGTYLATVQLGGAGVAAARHPVDVLATSTVDGRATGGRAATRGVPAVTAPRAYRGRPAPRAHPASRFGSRPPPLPEVRLTGWSAWATPGSAGRSTRCTQRWLSGRWRSSWPGAETSHCAGA